MVKTSNERLCAVLKTFERPGSCEASLAILKGMTTAQQSMAGVKFAKQIDALATQFPRFKSDAPVAAQAAREAIELGL